MSDPRVIVALDYPDAGRADELVQRLQPDACRLKVGFELFVSAGPVFVADLVDRGFGVFLDLKFHDIPNTVAAACHAAAGLGVWMLNVHASGGRRMMEAAREGLDGIASPPRLIGVTVLTSMGEGDLVELGIDARAGTHVERLAQLARDSGLDGVVCSAVEASALRARLGPEFLLVTPGIRPESSVADDQRRIATPVAARQAGADYLVIGRPITGAADPAGALEAVNRQLAEAVDRR
jgi:orotidine-5'-phosphate decarboxylase